MTEADAATSETDAIVIERSVNVPPDIVWPYFSNGGLWSKWQGRDCIIEPVPGGRFSVLLRPGVQASGEVVAVDENARLVFTFGWTGGPPGLPPGSTTVEITLTPVPPNGTRIRLTHRGLPDGLSDLNRSGWDVCLTALTEILDVGGDVSEAPSRG